MERSSPTADCKARAVSGAAWAASSAASTPMRTERSRAAALRGARRWNEGASARRTVAQSAAVRAMGPILSSVHESGIAPRRLTSPYVGRSPVTPQNADGVPIEPLVSEPSAYGTSPAATAAAEPLDDPPLQRSASHGLRVAPCSDADG